MEVGQSKSLAAQRTDRIYCEMRDNQQHARPASRLHTPSEQLVVNSSAGQVARSWSGAWLQTWDRDDLSAQPRDHGLCTPWPRGPLLGPGIAAPLQTRMTMCPAVAHWRRNIDSGEKGAAGASKCKTLCGRSRAAGSAVRSVAGHPSRRGCRRGFHTRFCQGDRRCRRGRRCGRRRGRHSRCQSLSDPCPRP